MTAVFTIGHATYALASILATVRSARPRRAGEHRRGRLVRARADRAARAAARGTGCRRSAISPPRLASAARPSAPACARWPRWASSSRGTARAPTFPTARPRWAASRCAFRPRSTGSPARRCTRRDGFFEVGAAGLAAERATPEQMATLAEEVTNLYASLATRSRSWSTTSSSIAASPRHRATRSSPRSSRWCRRCTTNGGARRRRWRRIATCATRRTCTGASTRRSAPATPTARGDRCTIIWCRRSGTSHRKRRRATGRPAGTTLDPRSVTDQRTAARPARRRKGVN